MEDCVLYWRNEECMGADVNGASTFSGQRDSCPAIPVTIPGGAFPSEQAHKASLAASPPNLSMFRTTHSIASLWSRKARSFMQL